MWVTENLFKLIDDCTFLSGNIIYLTDLENVRYVRHSTSSENINLPISRKLLQVFLNFSFTDMDSNYCLLNGKENIVPIYEDSSLNIDWSSQIILPLYADDTFYGSLISVNYHKEFNKQHLEFAKTTQAFVEKHLLNILNEHWREKNENNEE
ncbi:MAG: hypothetical protein RR144_06125 [Clostridia bacterium]